MARETCAVEADLDVCYGSRDGAVCAEFSSEGFDDGTAASGRGWAMGGAGRLVGHIFIHKGDDSGFVAERERLLGLAFAKGSRCSCARSRSAQRIGGDSFKRPLPAGFRMPAKREIDPGL